MKIPNEEIKEIFRKTIVDRFKKEVETIEHAGKEALKQIKEKRYAESLKGFRTIICYGIAFEGKDCLVVQLDDE